MPKFTSIFTLGLMVVFLTISSTPVLAIGDGSVVSNLGSNLGSGNLGSNVGSGQVLSNIGSGQILSNLGSGQIAEQVEVVVEENLDYEELKTRIDERLTTAIARNDAAITAINTSNLDEHDKEEITASLTILGENLAQYQADVAATQSLPELQELNEDVKAYLQENQTVVQDAVTEAVIQLAGYAVVYMDDFFAAVEAFLFSEALTSCNTEAGLAAYADLFESMSELEASLFTLSSTVYGYGQEIEQTEEGAFLYDTEDELLLSSLIDGTVNSDTDLDGTMDLVISSSGDVFLQNSSSGYTAESLDEDTLILSESNQTITVYADATVEVEGATKVGHAVSNLEGGTTQIYNTGLMVSTNADGDVTVNTLENDITVVDGVITLTDADGILITLEESGVSAIDVWNNQMEIDNNVITTTDALGNVMIYENGEVSVTPVAAEELIASVETQMAEVKIDAQSVLEDVSAVYNTCYVSI